MAQQFRKIPIKWEDANFSFDNSISPLGEPYTWDDVFLLETIIAFIKDSASWSVKYKIFSS